MNHYIKVLPLLLSGCSYIRACHFYWSGLYVLIYGINLIALSDCFYWVFAWKDIYKGLLKITPSHVIPLSGFLGQNCTSVIKNNHWFGRELNKWKCAVCFINKSCNTVSVAARGKEKISFRSGIQMRQFTSLRKEFADKITIISHII